MKKVNNDENNDERINDCKHESIDYTGEDKQETNDVYSDEIKEVLRELPKSEWIEENIEHAPFPIRDGNDLRRSKNQYRCYNWILFKLPIEEHKLITLMNFMFNRQRRESYPIVNILLNVDLLQKKNGVLIPTIEFVNYIKGLYCEIEKYEKENQQ